MPASDPQRGCAIAVMAKAPRPGQVKTRLVPPLTAHAAASLSASFLGDITRNITLAAEQAPIHGYVAFAPSGHETLFDGMLAPGTGLVLADGTGDMPERVQGFGRSLVHAVQALFALGHESVCLLNSDSPTLPTTLLAQAALALAEAGDRVVLGPADDGGYYLIGLKAPHWHLFEDIAWSTDQVADQTRERARTLGLELVELESWYDVDDRAALQRLLNEFAGASAGPGLMPYHAPATRECVATQRLSDLFSPDESAETLTGAKLPAY